MNWRVRWRKRLILLLGLLSVVLLATAAWLQWGPKSPLHRINRESFEQIREGMTLKEVEEIIGVPSGDYQSDVGSSVSYGLRPRIMGEGQGLHFHDWVGEDYVIRVSFYEDTVARKEATDQLHWHPESSLARLRLRLRHHLGLGPGNGGSRSSSSNSRSVHYIRGTTKER